MSPPAGFSFITFHELDPTTNQKCIYFTKVGGRCSNNLSREDRTSAMQLSKEIAEYVDADEIDSDALMKVVRKYARRNCCRRANHRDHIKDKRELDALVDAWLSQIQSQLDLQEESRQASAATCADVGAENAPSTDSPESSRTSRANSETNTAITDPSSASAILTPDPPTRQRYNLRPRLQSPSLQSSEPLSEFRKHKKRPNRDENISLHLRQPLVSTRPKFDHRARGAIYMFSRVSSPGHVKIGFTTKHVQKRLEEWKKQCGYTPVLVCSYSGVPYAHRVETLIHFELVAEWRREKICKGCTISHKEWFEVTQERASEVICGWVRFMREAKPYDDENGNLEAYWQVKLNDLRRRREAITVEVLQGIHDRRKEEEKAKEIEQRHAQPEGHHTSSTVAHPSGDQASTPDQIDKIAQGLLSLRAEQQDSLSMVLCKVQSILDSGAVDVDTSNTTELTQLFDEELEATTMCESDIVEDTALAVASLLPSVS